MKYLPPQSMLFDHNEIKLEITDTKISGNPPNIWKLNNRFLTTHWSKKELSGKLEDILR